MHLKKGEIYIKISEEISESFPSVIFLNIESFHVPKSIESYHILRIFSVDYNAVEVHIFVQ